MHFMTAFMSMATRIWAGVAIWAGTVAKFTSTVATLQNHWPFDEKVWPLLLQLWPFEFCAINDI